MGLRTFADGPVAIAALLGILCVAHGEVVVPGRSKVAHDLAVAEHLGGALVGPDVAGLSVALVGEVLSLLHPGLHSLGNLQVVVGVHPGLVNVVGEYAVGSGLGSGHHVALGLGLRGNIIEFVPVGQGLLDFCGIIGAQDILCDGAAVDQRGGAALEGDTLDDAVGIGSALHGVSIGIGEVGNAQLGDILGEVGAGVLLDVVSFGQEQVHLVVSGGIFLVQQSLVQLFLVSAVVTGGNDPVDGDTFGNGVVLLEEALELLVPGIDVEHLALGGLFGGSLGLGIVCLRCGSGCGRGGGCGLLRAAGTQCKDHGQRKDHG